jgi:hypothetical protein
LLQTLLDAFSRLCFDFFGLSQLLRRQDFLDLRGDGGLLQRLLDEGIACRFSGGDNLSFCAVFLRSIQGLHSLLSGLCALGLSVGTGTAGCLAFRST